jgi:hypothetical protein
MVKKAEVEHKRNPLTPIFGLLLAVGLLAVAYVITDQVLLKSGNYIGGHVLAVIGQVTTLYRVAFTVAIWVALLAVAYFLVAVMVGKDPNDSSTIPLPPKQKNEKTYKRR